MSAQIFDLATLQKRSAALGKIIEVVSAYLPPDSGIEPSAALGTIIRIIETEGGHEFLKLLERG